MGIFGGRRGVSYDGGAGMGRERHQSYGMREGFEQRALAFISPPIGPYTQAIQDMSADDPEGALRHSAVWACADLIASCMAMLTPWAYEGDGVGHGEAIRVQNQPDILIQPSADADIADFTYMGTMSLATKGNEFGRVLARDRRTLLPVQVELENPGVVRVRKQGDGTYEYRFRNEVVKPPELWHKAMYRFPGSPLGMSPLQYAAKVTRQGLNAEQFGNQYFEDGGHPSGVLTNDTAKLVSQDDARTLKQRFVEALRLSREPVVLGGGWKYQKVQITPDESMFLDTQKLSDTKICRYMGRVPPELIGAASEGSNITYANVEQRAMHFLTFTMFRWIKRWEMWLGDCLPPGLYCKFDTDALQRVDFLTKWTGLHMAIGSRIMTQGEGREKADLSNTRIPVMAPAIEAELDKLVTPLPAPVARPNQGV
jgi:HK97 family phage portal protein